MKKVLITIAVGLMLAGCAGGGPSKSDVEAALIQHFEQASGMRTSFDRFDVGRCEKVEGGPGHACAVDGQAVIDVGGRAQQETLRATFVFDQVGGAWKVVSVQ